MRGTRIALFVAVPLAAIAALPLLHMALIEVGHEVVVVRTRAPGGAAEETRLWIVDGDGAAWLLTGSSARWLARLRAEPDVEVERAGRVEAFRAQTVPEARERVLAWMRAKYGLADRWVRFVTGTEHAVPVRLDPQ